MRWALQRLFRSSREGFAKGWQQIPPRARLNAFVITAVGFALCGACSFGASRLGRWLHGRGMAEWDERVFHWIQELSPFGFVGAILAESPGNFSYLFPLTTAVAVFLFLRARPLEGIGILAAYWGTRPLIDIGWYAWDRARPDLIANGIASPELHSFPSGHAALSTAAYGFLAYLWSRASDSRLEKAFAVALATAWVALISLARMRLGTHWPSDIIAGVAIGLAWLFVLIFALRRAEGKAFGAGASGNASFGN